MGIIRSEEEKNLYVESLVLEAIDVVVNSSEILWKERPHEIIRVSFSCHRKMDKYRYVGSPYVPMSQLSYTSLLGTFMTKLYFENYFCKVTLKP